jgi:hypothetical protein
MTLASDSDGLHPYRTSVFSVQDGFFQFEVSESNMGVYNFYLHASVFTGKINNAVYPFKIEIGGSCSPISYSNDALLSQIKVN